MGRLRSLLAHVMLPVDTTMAVMCHAPFVCCMLFHGSGCRCDYCMFSRSVDTCRRPVVLMMCTEFYSHCLLRKAALFWCARRTSGSMIQCGRRCPVVKQYEVACCEHVFNCVSCGIVAAISPQLCVSVGVSCAYCGKVSWQILFYVRFARWRI